MDAGTAKVLLPVTSRGSALLEEMTTLFSLPFGRTFDLLEYRIGDR